MGDSAEKTAKPSFFKGVKAEFGKISWPDKQSTFKQSVAVVAISVVVGLIIAILDYIIQYGVNILTSIYSEGDCMAEANLYVVHTYSGYENKVKANIQKTIENNKHLAAQIIEVRCHMYDVVDTTKVAETTINKKLFHDYVLLIV